MGYKIAIIGGGSLYTLPLLATVCSPKEDYEVDELRMFDIDSDRQRLRFDAGKILVNEISPNTKMIEAQTLKEAVKDVDYVLIQIRSGGLDMREADEKIPLHHGLVGQETVGAGGLMYGMRSVKDTIEIVKTIREYSEKAWIINFANPASILAEATRRYFRNDPRLVYICDMTILMLDAFESALGLPKGELNPSYFGLNHFGWFTKICDSEGNDRMGEIKKLLVKGNVVPDELKNDQDWVDTFNNLGKMIKDYGEYIPSTYMQYYYYPLDIVAHSNPEHTRATTVKEKKQFSVEKMCRQIIEQNSTENTGLFNAIHGQYIMDVIDATIHYDENRRFLLCVTNDGVIPNVNKDATVEIPCIIGRNGIEKSYVGEVGPFYQALMENEYNSERLVVDAVLENNITKALQGFTLNRMINDGDTARTLLKEMLEKNKEYLPELYQQSKSL